MAVPARHRSDVFCRRQQLINPHPRLLLQTAGRFKGAHLVEPQRVPTQLNLQQARCQKNRSMIARYSPMYKPTVSTYRCSRVNSLLDRFIRTDALYICCIRSIANDPNATYFSTTTQVGGRTSADITVYKYSYLVQSSSSHRHTMGLIPRALHRTPARPTANYHYARLVAYERQRTQQKQRERIFQRIKLAPRHTGTHTHTHRRAMVCISLLNAYTYEPPPPSTRLSVYISMCAAVPACICGMARRRSRWVAASPRRRPLGCEATTARARPPARTHVSLHAEPTVAQQMACAPAPQSLADAGPRHRRRSIAHSWSRRDGPQAAGAATTSASAAHICALRHHVNLPRARVASRRRANGWLVATC